VPLWSEVARLPHSEFCENAINNRSLALMAIPCDDSSITSLKMSELEAQASTHERSTNGHQSNGRCDFQQGRQSKAPPFGIEASCTRCLAHLRHKIRSKTPRQTAKDKSTSIATARPNRIGII
jgi:hypothetical protein